MCRAFEPKFVSKVKHLKTAFGFCGLKVWLAVLTIINFSCFSQSYLDLAPSYIAKHKELAIEQMVRFNIPASVILAQAIKESGSGSSFLAQNTQNHFGIKCHREWGGETFNKDDDTLNECFRSYSSVYDSYLDHSLFLLSRPRYAFVLDNKLSDYASWCFGLKQAGYATSPNYANDLIAIIEQFRLYLLDGADYIQPAPISGFLACSDKEDIIKTSSFLNFIQAEKAILAKVIFNQSTEEEVFLVSTNDLAKRAE
jgi:hypothetical protein